MSSRMPWLPFLISEEYFFSECDCNGHAAECRFDNAVFANSGNVSGGVCVNCLHNTVGRKCEKCKPLHYQDPTRDFREAAACIRKYCLNCKQLYLFLYSFSFHLHLFKSASAISQDIFFCNYGKHFSSESLCMRNRNSRTRDEKAWTSK